MEGLEVVAEALEEVLHPHSWLKIAYLHLLNQLGRWPAGKKLLLTNFWQASVVIVVAVVAPAEDVEVVTVADEVVAVEVVVARPEAVVLLVEGAAVALVLGVARKSLS